MATNLKTYVPQKRSSSEFADIERPKLILVEGVDDMNFIHALLNDLQLADIQILDVGSKNNLQKELKSLYLRYGPLYPLESLAIIRDTDNEEPNKILQKLAEFLRDLEWTPPDKLGEFSNSRPRIGIYTLPGLSAPGNLESLLLQGLEQRHDLGCVNDFYGCVLKSAGKDTSLKKMLKNNKAKIKASAYLLTTRFSDTRVGLAAERGYWNLQHHSLDPLKAFLKAL